MFQTADQTANLLMRLEAQSQASPADEEVPPSRPGLMHQQIHMLWYGLIYIWKFVKPGHPLNGIIYIGQVYRTGMLHGQAFRVRTREHLRDAINLIGDKDWGLHALLKKFGKECFEYKIVEKKTFTNEFECKKWMNERERALIKENGGQMKCLDYMPRGGQTLNLTDGGQASSDEGIQNLLDFLHRRSTSCFGNFVRCKKKWNEENPGRTYPSQDEVIIDPNTGETYNIGKMDSDVRNANCFNAKEDPERKAVLDEMGMVWNVMDAREEFWLNETKWFKNKYGIRNPRTTSKDPRIKALGIKHTNIRCCNNFGILTDASKLERWKEAGFIPDFAAHKMKPFLKELDEENPDLRKSNPEIGNLVNHIRSQGMHVRGRRDLLEKLHEKEFKMHAMNSSKNDEIWEELLTTLTCDKWEKYHENKRENYHEIQRLVNELSRKRERERE